MKELFLKLGQPMLDTYVTAILTVSSKTRVSMEMSLLIDH